MMKEAKSSGAVAVNWPRLLSCASMRQMLPMSQYRELLFWNSRATLWSTPGR